MNADQRKKRRQKIRELTMYLLEQNERGLSFQYLQTTVDNCVRYRVSRHSLTKVMKSELETGIIISELDRERKTVWKLSSAYRTAMETV